MKAHLPIKYGFDTSRPPEVPSQLSDVGQFTASYDQRLWMFHRYWEPAKNTNVQATLIIVHGTVDHSGAYDELAKKLTQVGIAVFALDMRGWGLSDGESMYIDNIDTFVSDVENLYRHVHSLPRYQDIKSRFLMGKSLGGTVTAFCVAKYPRHWTGIMGLSGAYQVDQALQPSSFVIALLKGLSKVFPKRPFKTLFDEHLIVADEKALQAWREDPLCCKDKLRLGYVVSIFDSLKILSQSIVPQINLPMLMMCGDADRVVTLSGHELMINVSRHQDKRLIVYRNGLHNLLQEPSVKLALMSDIEEWILARS
jgi:alpha-beta hydrolase superfamily lysophospholipase